ncbi:transporter substrate-binding domain-containing protein [Burkholderia dolosa]|uniref:Transporter substrate-binding domain-containing protein n=1 Tax=Burkholderia dolosa TaxID=152500 RepID=A0A892II18_9BURK|nr:MULTISPECIES: transporter substrate-binding domain-containing protein [Burkholderia]AKE01619.1 cytochrome C [Burkholderia cepacia]AJY11599.1 cytochrome c family protein [Burkholderia dolosa AU0158]AYZ95965.1 cytochrome C [Burkholderia dolosa]ETP61313.1 cytochrome C [Burkholderia dolosa PC543]MBR8421297.1 transporter substrate-binding domain-containing protein [Burkholderia dolosa]
MNIRLPHFAAACALAAGTTLAPATSAVAAPVRVCSLPGTPTAALDKAVARAAFRTAGIAATFAARSVDGSDDDGVSAHELVKVLEHDCDVLAGFPRSAIADASDTTLLFSQGYLRSGYVSVTRRDAGASAADREIVAATYASPAQLIAVQQKNARFDLENTSEQTVDAVAHGRAHRAIVWYPAVVAYRAAHPKQTFRIEPTASPYANWQLTFAFASRSADLQQRIDAALTQMKQDGRLAALTRRWALPGNVTEARESRATPRFLDGATAAAGAARAGLLRARSITGGGFVRVAAGTGDAAPGFDAAQVEHGKTLYGTACAKCHGADLEGNTAPALSGPSFAPLSHSHLTIGGVFGYMATNMPADQPGKLKDDEYADLMAFLLASNGYAPGKDKLSADAARASAAPLVVGPAGHKNASQ